MYTTRPHWFFPFFFLRIRPPPRSPLFPYTPLSRSLHAGEDGGVVRAGAATDEVIAAVGGGAEDPLARLYRKSTRLNSSHSQISYAVFCLKKKKNINYHTCRPMTREQTRSQLNSRHS